MPTNVQNATELVDAVDAFVDLAAQQSHFLLVGDVWHLASEHILLHFLENPWCAYRGSAHHNAVHAVAVVVFFQFLGRSDVAVADNGDVHTGVVLHLANQRPVGFTGVHLATGAAMDGEGLNTAILQLLCHFHNVLGVAVPTEAGFCSHRQIHGIDHRASDFAHQRNIAEQA